MEEKGTIYQEKLKAAIEALSLSEVSVSLSTSRKDYIDVKCQTSAQLSLLESALNKLGFKANLKKENQTFTLMVDARKMPMPVGNLTQSLQETYNGVKKAPGEEGTEPHSLEELKVARERLQNVIQSLALPLNTSVESFADGISLDGILVKHKKDGQLRPLERALDKLNIKYGGPLGILYIPVGKETEAIDFSTSLEKAYEEECAKVRESLFYVNHAMGALVGGFFIAVGVGIIVLAALVIPPLAIIGILVVGVGSYTLYDSIEMGKNYSGGSSLAGMKEDEPPNKETGEKENLPENKLEENREFDPSSYTEKLLQEKTPETDHAKTLGEKIIAFINRHHF